MRELCNGYTHTSIIDCVRIPLLCRHHTTVALPRLGHAISCVAVPPAAVIAITIAPIVLRSKGLKDTMCVGWFGDDWVGLVGSPPKSIDHVSSMVPVGYAVYK